MYGLYQASGGIVDAALANAVHVQLARGHGATVIDHCPVLRLEPTAEGGAKVSWCTQNELMIKSLDKVTRGGRK